MSEHTKGPWRWSQNPYGGARVETQSVGIADVLSRAGVPHPVQESCAANARLIASAPDLLEALERLVAEVEDGEDQGICPLCLHSRTLHSDNCALVEARLAIAKARGGDAMKGCGMSDCRYERPTGMRPVGSCKCDDCPTCGGTVRPGRPSTHYAWCPHKDWVSEHQREKREEAP